MALIDYLRRRACMLQEYCIQCMTGNWRSMPELACQSAALRAKNLPNGGIGLSLRWSRDGGGVVLMADNRETYLRGFGWRSSIPHPRDTPADPCRFSFSGVSTRVTRLTTSATRSPRATPPSRVPPTARIGCGNSRASDSDSACALPRDYVTGPVRWRTYLNTYWPTQLRHPTGRHFAAAAPSAKRGEAA
jgi:hypothetical protein